MNVKGGQATLDSFPRPIHIACIQEAGLTIVRCYSRELGG